MIDKSIYLVIAACFFLVWKYLNTQTDTPISKSDLVQDYSYLKKERIDYLEEYQTQVQFRENTIEIKDQLNNQLLDICKICKCCDSGYSLQEIEINIESYFTAISKFASNSQYSEFQDNTKQYILKSQELLKIISSWEIQIHEGDFQIENYNKKYQNITGQLQKWTVFVRRSNQLDQEIKDLNFNFEGFYASLSQDCGVNSILTDKWCHCDEHSRLDCYDDRMNKYVDLRKSYIIVERSCAKELEILNESEKALEKWKKGTAEENDKKRIVQLKKEKYDMWLDLLNECRNTKQYVNEQVDKASHKIQDARSHVELKLQNLQNSHLGQKQRNSQEDFSFQIDKKELTDLIAFYNHQLQALQQCQLAEVALEAARKELEDAKNALSGYSSNRFYEEQYQNALAAYRQCQAGQSSQKQQVIMQLQQNKVDIIRLVQSEYNCKMTSITELEKVIQYLYDELIGMKSGLTTKKEKYMAQMQLYHNYKQTICELQTKIRLEIETRIDL